MPEHPAVRGFYLWSEPPVCGLSGAVCCREDWKPVLNLQAVVYGLVFLFLVGACGRPRPGRLAIWVLGFGFWGLLDCPHAFRSPIRATR